MIRAVADTNVLVRALIRPDGPVGRGVRYLRDGRLRLLYSDGLLEELVDVLGRPRIREKYGLTSDDIAALLEVIYLRGEVVVPTREIRVSRDPDDNILAVAVCGRADVIVTGDDDLLVLEVFEEIPILSPAAFLTLAESR